MRTIAMSPMTRLLAILATLNVAGACTDATSPDLSETPRASQGGLMVSPSAASLRPGDVVLLQARRITGSGQIARAAVTWSSSNESVASVSERGEVVGLGEGHAVITARTDAESQIATIRVLAPPRPDKPRLYLKPNMEPTRKQS